MRAILLLPGSDGSAQGAGRLGHVLAPLIDRPFIRHVPEYIIDRGVRRAEIVLPRSLDVVAGVLGDGRRWGVELSYHFCGEGMNLYSVLRHVVAPDDEMVLVGHADRLPALSLRVDDRAEQSMHFFGVDPYPGWTGWSVVPAHALHRTTDARQKADLLSSLNAQLELKSVRVPVLHQLSVESEADLLRANLQVIGDQFTGLFMTGRQVRPGYWLGRGASIHPNATVHPPVYIGEHVRVAEGAQVGPFAVIGHDCLIAREARIASTAVCPYTYVGAGLELSNMLVEGGYAYHAQIGAAVDGIDEALLSSLANFSWRSWLQHQAGRVAAAGAFTLALPGLSWLALWHRLRHQRWPMQRQEMLCLPAVEDELRWRTGHVWSLDHPTRREQVSAWSRWWYQVAPAMLSVAKGDLALFGQQPLAPAEVRALPKSMQRTYLSQRAGVLARRDASVKRASAMLPRSAAKHYTHPDAQRTTSLVSSSQGSH